MGCNEHQQAAAKHVLSVRMPAGQEQSVGIDLQGHQG